MKELDNDKKQLKQKNIELEDRNRRNNLRIDVIKESNKETSEESKKKLKEMIRNKLEVKDNIKIERVHRVGPKDKEHTRTVVLKLMNYSYKEKIQKNIKILQRTKIYIINDYSEETTKMRKQLFD